MNFSLRQATEEDQEKITGLIHQVGINPTGLSWQRFIVAEDESGNFIGCGQTKPHDDGTREIASLAVEPTHQGQGVGSAILNRLMHENPPPLYLMCRSPLAPYYQRFGFRSLEFKELPRSYRLVWRGAKVLARLFPGKFPGLSVMMYANQER